MNFPPNFLDEIRARLPVSEICGKRVNLKKQGREFVGLSPFNNEKTPSFTVNDEKGFYHCFSSGKHGDIFSFIMAVEGLSFPEAVEKLASDAGLEVPRATAAERARSGRRSGLNEVMDLACRFFQQSLLEPCGDHARKYIEGRGLDAETISKFRLGYAPPGNAMPLALRKAGISESSLLECGLLRASDNGQAAYAFFRDRVLFPITDRSGRVIGFGGRLMGDGNTAKYINSPDTILFSKGRTLYNLANARQAAHEGHPVIVVEGYMDVIALDRAGFKGAVAPLGTALTENQLEEIWRLNSEPVLCFDGDSAGARAAMKAAERSLELLRPGRSVQFAYLPAGDDPDSLIAAQGPQAISEVITSARPLVDMLWAYEYTLKTLDTPERRADFEVRLGKRVSVIADGSVQQHYRQIFRDRVWQIFRNKRLGGNSHKNQFIRPVDYSRKIEQPSTGHLRANVAAMRSRRMQVLLATILKFPALLDDFGEALAEITISPDLDKLLQEIQHWYSKTQGLDADDLRSHLYAQGFKKIVNSLDSKEVMSHAAFARDTSDGSGDYTVLLSRARKGFEQTLNLFMRAMRKQEVLASGRVAAGDGTEESERRFLAFRRVMEDETADMLGGNGFDSD